MAEIDGVVLTTEQLHIQQLQTQIQQLVGQLKCMQSNLVPQIIPPANRPDLNLPLPPSYSGNPLELTTFKNQANTLSSRQLQHLFRRSISAHVCACPTFSPRTTMV